MEKFKAKNFLEAYSCFLGVYFRQWTKEKAEMFGRLFIIYYLIIILGLVGWVQNTDKGTVEGTVQGPEERISLM